LDGWVDFVCEGIPGWTHRLGHLLRVLCEAYVQATPFFQANSIACIDVYIYRYVDVSGFLCRALARVFV
jgi:hypothetical protein